MDGGLLHLWKKWEIQILMLLSFTLQVILFAFARLRRRKGSAFFRVLLWLAYLMADYTAIYALGHLSISARSSEKQLVTLWASLLLLHLGGPDTITAYAFQDNQLWLRHLLILIVQVMGAAYVLYQSISTQKTLFIPSLLMFITGLLKYGERTWALKCANIDSIRSSLDTNDDSNRRQPYDGRVGTTELDEEEILLGAHFVFNTCKSKFTDDWITCGSEQRAISEGIRLNRTKYMYQFIEMQLSLMYDIMYTKASVIFTWHGSCIRVISLVATLASIFLFQLNSRGSYYIRADVIVTWILLLGAFVLEITSLVMTIGSSWTCAFLHARKWDWILVKVLCLRRLVRAASSRRWMDSIGQYNLLDFCTRDRSDRRSRIFKKVGLEKWWNNLHYSSTTKISESFWDLLLKTIPEINSRNVRGQWTLQKWKIGDSTLYDEISWTIDGGPDLEESILTWHVATDLYLCCSHNPAVHDVEKAKAVKELSDYMLFLYVVQSDMLPGQVRKSLYDNACHALVKFWEEHSSDPMDSTLTPREKLATLLYRTYGEDNCPPIDPPGMRHIINAVVLIETLHKESLIPDTLDIIAGVLIEVLCYSARHCSDVSHAKQLSSGGELATAVGLLFEYTNTLNIPDNRRRAVIPMVNGEPNGTAAGEVSIDINAGSGGESDNEINEENHP